MDKNFKPKRRADRDVIAYAEFTGLRNDVASERFDATDLAVADNVNLDDSRRIVRRAGATRVVNLPVRSLWARGDKALCAAGLGLYEVNPDLSMTQIGQVGPGSLAYERVGDTIYINDGASPRALDGGALRTWGLDVPPAPMVTLAGGNLTPGQYAIATTYVRADGQESGASEAQFVDVIAGLQITLIGSLDPAVTEQRVYMTVPNGETLMHVATLLAGTTTYLPVAADIAAANEPLKTNFMGPPPPGRLVAYYRGRMFVAQGRYLYPSEPFAYELFDQRNYIEMDGDITMLAPIEDRSGEASGFFIGTTKSCGILAGSGPDTFSYVTKTDYPAVLGALDYIDGALFGEGELGARPLPVWLTTQGLCMGMPSLEVNNLTRSRYTFPAAGAGAGAALFDGNYFIAVSSGNPAIVMNAQNETLTTYSSFDYESFARVHGRMVAASSAGLFELVGDTDAGQPIAAQVAFGTTDFGSTFMKGLDRLYIGYRASTGLVVRILTEGTHWNLYEMPATSANDLASQRVKTGRGLAARYWQFALANVGGADFEIDTVDVKSTQLARRVNGRA